MNPAKLAQTLNEALALHQRGDLAKAEGLYRAILKKAPQHFEALHLLGVLADQRGDRTNGITLVRQALKIQSAWPEAHYNLGRMLYAEGDMAGAQQHFTQAIALKPNLFQAHNDLGSLYRRQGAYGEAAACFERATRYEPRYLEAYINLCNTYRDSRAEAKILDVADRGLRVDPNCAPLWQLRAEAAFTIGRLAEGWRDYNWRFSATGQKPPDAPPYTLPFWQGEDLAGKSILIWGEQGIGDQLLYANMLAGMAKLARRCVLHTTPRLVPLFARAFPNVEVFAGTVPADITRTLDFQAPMGSIGEWRRPTFTAFPAATDYLKPDPAKVAALRAKYQGGRKTMLVGIAWRSVANFRGAVVGEAAEKSVGLNQWGAILSIPGITFVNLQYGDVAAEIAAARDAFKATIVEDASVDTLADLDALAAQIAAMDLVISSSNSAVHMAGALGVPTWCMVPRALSKGRRWYWFGDGLYAPWYRAVTLFRQTRTDWMDVLAEIALALVAAASKSGVLADAGRYLDGLAQGYRSAGLAQEAGKVLVQAAALAPSPRRLMEAAQVQLKQGAFPAALTSVTQVTAHADAPAEAHDLHGRILARLNRFADAATAYRKALVITPTAETYNNLGTALRRAGRSAEAQASYAEAIKLKPDHPAILLNYATVLTENDRLDDALAAYDRLVALQPGNADAHYNRATTLLNAGRLVEGWDEFKWRLKRTGVHVRHEDFPQPVWSGQDLTGKHVLIWTDLGIGEEVLTASLVPDAATAARRVTLLCSARLVTLFRRSFPDVIVDIRAAPLPPAALSKDIDVQMSLAELGAAFRPSFAAFPTRKPFLAADDNLRARLRAKYLAGKEDTKLVGISWRSVHPDIGHQKSVPLVHWLPILKTPGVTFVNLQYGDCQAELSALHRDHGITVIHDPDIDPFGDIDPVAAQVAAMDQVISVSNTTVHLAGGLGIPAWVMVPQGLGRMWYWFRTTPHCSWYPSLTLRTPQGDDGWNALLEDVGADLKRWRETPHG